MGEIKVALKKEVKTEGDQLVLEILQCRNITYKFKSPDHLPGLDKMWNSVYMHCANQLSSYFYSLSKLYNMHFNLFMFVFYLNILQTCTWSCMWWMWLPRNGSSRKRPEFVDMTGNLLSMRPSDSPSIQPDTPYRWAQLHCRFLNTLKKKIFLFVQMDMW